MSAGPNVGHLLGVIDRLEELLAESELLEIEVEAGGTTLILRKPGAIAPPAPAAGTGNAAPDAGHAGPPVSEGRADTSDPRFHAVLAPLTGVFYTSPSPGAAPYLRVGGPVSTGQVIGLIEAMKLFNEIKSDVSGTVRRIAAESGALVKAKQTLIEVEP